MLMEMNRSDVKSLGTLDIGRRHPYVNDRVCRAASSAKASRMLQFRLSHFCLVF
ncbi:hypothetical protein WG66_005430 [Moniliophthora roreri]|nr:hypothetical protein WG66_005430 [Moniliophthora roreri]